MVAILDNLDNVTESLKEFYTEGEDGKFTLDVERLQTAYGAAKDETAKVVKHNGDLLTEKREAAKKAKEALEQAQQAAIDQAKKEGDMASLANSFSEKENSLLAQINALKTERNTERLNQASTQLAAEIAMQDCMEVVQGLVKQRIRYEEMDGNQVLIVLDKNGNPTTNSMTDLKKELLADKGIAPLLRGTGSSGSGAEAGAKSGGAAKKYHEMTSDELVRLSKDNPAEYERLLKAQ